MSEYSPVKKTIISPMVVFYFADVINGHDYWQK